MRRKTSIYSYEQTHCFHLLLIYFSFSSPLSSISLVLWSLSLFFTKCQIFFSPPLIPLTPSYPFIFPSKCTKSCTISKIYLGFLNFSVKFTLLFAEVGDAAGSNWVAAVKGEVKTPYLISQTQLTLELCYKRLILLKDSTPSQFVEM